MLKRLFSVAVLLYMLAPARAQVVQLVKEIDNSPGGSSSPHDLVVAGGNLFFIATDNAVQQGIYVSGGNAGNTQKVGPTTGNFGSLRYLASFNNKVYFSFDDGVNGSELWVTDATPGSSSMVTDLNPGPNGSDPRLFTVAGDKLYFLGYNGSSTNVLYATDGTPGGTTMIKPYADLLNGMDTFAVMNNELYFRSDDGTGYGYGWWKTDGTPGGTILLKAGLVAGTLGGNVAVLNDKMYFSADDGVYDSELWVTDGTPAGTQVVKDINPAGTSFPQNLKVYNGKIYFSAHDNTHGDELWVTDGTDGGTQMVKDIVPGANSSLPVESIVYNGLLYFTCAITSELWKSDGTDAGTLQVKTGLQTLDFAAVWNNKMYLYYSNFTLPLWESDGTAAGTKEAVVTNTTSPISPGGPAGNFVEYNSELYFNATTFGISDGYEPTKLTLGPTPLTLLWFKGEELNGQDVLRWKTANEINTSHFEVEASHEGSLFKPAGAVSASGNSVLGREYEYARSSSANTAGYYRLKMVDKDNRFTYSPVVKIRRATPPQVVVKYNNEAKELVVYNPNGQPVTWVLLSANGSILQRGKFTGASNQLSMTTLRNGVYIFSYEKDGKKEGFRLVKY